MSATLHRLGSALGRLLHGPDRLETVVAPEGPRGDIAVPRAGDGGWEVRTVQGRPCLAPDERSHYLYFQLPPAFRSRAGVGRLAPEVNPGARASGAHAASRLRPQTPVGLWVEVEYFGDRFAQFRVQYASTDLSAEHGGLYKPAQQRWDGDAAGLSRFRRAVFPLPDFDAARTQNQDASFRIEFRQEVLVSRIAVTLHPPEGLDALRAVAPLPELKKLPGRFYPINYLFIEITNACNFKCTWCPDDIMGRKRGFMKKQKAFRILDEIAEKRGWMGPIFPVKLHQMGEPMLHPDLAAIVAHAESRGVAIELNTNCGLITRENIDGLYQAGLTNLILSYQTPDLASFKTRKAPRLAFDDYRDKVRLAVERKVALGARTHLEIDIMNTKYAEGYRIVSEDEQAIAFLRDWVSFARSLEETYGLPRREHDLDRMRARHFLDQDENGSRYELLDGVDLIWKRCHSWGNVIDTAGALASVDRQRVDGGAAGFTPAAEPGGSGGAPLPPPTSTYCPAPYDQFVIQWNGDVTTCCTDYEGRTKTANVFNQSIESVWTGELLKQRKRDMLEGRLLDVCARCQGVK